MATSSAKGRGLYTALRGCRRRCRPGVVRASVSEYAASRTVPGTTEHALEWKGFQLRYVHKPAEPQSGNNGKPAVLMLHGFGGNADHFKNNFESLTSEGCDVYALDVLGYGYSDKPEPLGDHVEHALAPTAYGDVVKGPSTTEDGRKLYCFENWADQALTLIDEVIGRDVVLVCNSVGGITGMQAAIAEKSKQQRRIRGVMIVDLSLRMLHITKTSAVARPFVAALQNALYGSSLGDSFFANVATPDTVTTVLKQAYGGPSGPVEQAVALLSGDEDDLRVDEDLVSRILTPGLRPNAARVFLDFISYSAGPTPEDLLASIDVPVGFIWGSRDPWEKVDWGRDLALRFDAAAGSGTVTCFHEVPNGGHCVMDQRPEAVNPLLVRFVDDVVSTTK